MQSATENVNLCAVPYLFKLILCRSQQRALVHSERMLLILIYFFARENVLYSLVNSL